MRGTGEGPCPEWAPNKPSPKRSLAKSEPSGHLDEAVADPLLPQCCRFTPAEPPVIPMGSLTPSLPLSSESRRINHC